MAFPNNTAQKIGGVMQAIRNSLKDAEEKLNESALLPAIKESANRFLELEIKKEKENESINEIEKQISVSEKKHDDKKKELRQLEQAKQVCLLTVFRFVNAFF